MEGMVWLIVGLIAGWLGGLVMKGSGYGLVGDILVGVLGAVAGALLFVSIVPPTIAQDYGNIVAQYQRAVRRCARLLTRRRYA